jgi:hypothetical protein
MKVNKGEALFINLSGLRFSKKKITGRKEEDKLSGEACSQSGDAVLKQYPATASWFQTGIKSTAASSG